ncbi:hypothetical protein C2U71_25950 [Burkholderia ubonensis]|nr:hypothetical protein C2U71_25950 [Burkholderia ubonensis]
MAAGPLRPRSCDSIQCEKMREIRILEIESIRRFAWPTIIEKSDDWAPNDLPDEFFDLRMNQGFG